MNLVKRAAQQVGAGLSLSDLDRMMDEQYAGRPVFSGRSVSQQTALAVSAVWACIATIADDIATLPLITYRRTEKGISGRERAPEHYLWDLLLLQVNPEMSAWRFFQLMQTWVLLWGNAYAEIEISGRGQVVGLWPWRPDKVRIYRDERGKLVYAYKADYQTPPVFLPDERVFHLRGFGTDGLVGLSPIDMHKQTIGVSLAITEHGGRYFANSARPSGVLTTDQIVGDKSYERIKKDWAETHQGLENSSRVAILEQGLKWQDTAQDLVDARYIEAQNLTYEDICRIYKVPQHRAGLLQRATNNNVEEMSLDYVLYTLSPWAANWQNQIHVDLLSSRENAEIYTAFDFTNLLRGDHESMSKFIAVMRQWGILNADEIRETYLDRTPIPGGAGKMYWEPVNMMISETKADQTKRLEGNQQQQQQKQIAPPAAEPDEAGQEEKKPKPADKKKAAELVNGTNGLNALLNK